MLGPDFLVSAARSTDDRAGVFELADDAAYFYLYDRASPEGAQVIGAIHVASIHFPLLEEDVEVRWSDDEEAVGLFLEGVLWAAFLGSEAFGGQFRPGGRPNIAPAVADRFTRAS